VPRWARLRRVVSASRRYGDAHFELSFSTGAGPAEPDPSANPGAISFSRFARTGRTLSRFCESVLQAQDCFDTGQNTHFVFEPEGMATAWLIREDRDHGPAPRLWPGICGAPDLFANDFSRPCVILSGIDRVGALHEGQRFCTPPPSAAEIPDDSSAMTEAATPVVSPVEPTPLPATDIASPIDVAPTVPSSSSHVGGCSLAPSHSSPTGAVAAALVALALAIVRRRKTS